MNALLQAQPELRPMTVADLDAVMEIEHAAYSVPWSRGNFIDSLASGYHCMVLRLARGPLLGYFVAMPGVDELHLLNITVDPAAQRRGHARAMLDAIQALCREQRALELWLEVRTSNLRARTLYERCGFALVSVRRAYYPLPAGESGREDALVMSLKLAEARHGVE